LKPKVLFTKNYSLIMDKYRGSFVGWWGFYGFKINLQ
jgi:hypothetical protein